MILAIDTETHEFGPGNMAPKQVCLSWCDGAKSGLIVGRQHIEPFLHLVLDRVIDDPVNNVIVGSFIAYDMVGSCANYGMDMMKKIYAAYEARGIFCTQVVEKLLDNAEGFLNDDTSVYSLEPLARKYLQMQLNKDGHDSWRTRYSELDGVPKSLWPKEAIDYPIQDAIATFKVFEKQLDRAEAIGYTLPDAPEQSYASFALYMATVWGMRTNLDHIQQYHGAVKTEMAKLRQELVKSGLHTIYTAKRGKNAGIPIGKKSNKLMQQLVVEAYASIGKDAPRTASGDRIALDKETLEDIQDLVPDIGNWLQFNKLEKTESTFIKPLYEGVTKPIHARFNELVATGRNSSSGPNLHNLPRKKGVRECFAARPGYVYISTDYNAQEMRTWAQACQTIVGFSRLAERFRADPDFDPHVAMAAQSLLKISEEEALTRLKAKDKKVKADRQASKIANFGLPGGMGVNGLIAYARNYDGSRWAEPQTCPGCRPGADWRERHNCFAARLKQSWLQTWPEASEYFYHVKSITEYGGVIVQLFSGRWRGGCGFTDGSNTYFQGLASDASKAAFCEVSRRSYTVETSWLFGFRPTVLIHDEIMGEGPEETAHEAAMEMKEVMEEKMSLFTPDVPPRASPALMRFWSKGAEAEYDESGRLIPWEDAHPEETAA